MGHWVTTDEGDHIYISDSGKVLATRAAISKASGGTERGKALAARSKAAILKKKADGAAKTSPQPPARTATPGVAKATGRQAALDRAKAVTDRYVRLGAKTRTDVSNLTEKRYNEQLPKAKAALQESRASRTAGSSAKAAASEAKATALEKQATQDYGRNPKLAEAGFSAAKKLRAEAKGRDPQLFAGPLKQSKQAAIAAKAEQARKENVDTARASRLGQSRESRMADAREGVKVRAANRAHALAKERGIPVAERVRGSEYRNLRAEVLKSGRASLARATPDAAKRIEAGKTLAEKRLPDRFPLFLKNPATSQAKPAAPSLREQAAAARAGKGTAEERIGKLGARADERLRAVGTKSLLLGGEADKARAMASAAARNYSPNADAAKEKARQIDEKSLSAKKDVETLAGRTKSLRLAKDIAARLSALPKGSEQYNQAAARLAGMRIRAGKLVSR